LFKSNKENYVKSNTSFRTGGPQDVPHTQVKRSKFCSPLRQ